MTRQRSRVLTVGDKVEILLYKGIFHLKHRKGPVYGVVTHTNGAYIDVRPSWCKWDIQQYPSELRKL